ncbi:MAG: adenylyl-sulfate kinase [Bacteroidetes bacterium]|nr:adenylyl-sulfate kinase [Bacteroidota bacterium]
MQENIFEQKLSINSENRSQLKGHRPLLIWLTGLSGSGKSTISNVLEIKLHELGLHTYLLDGDNIRLGLNQNLGFSPEDRQENLRRIAEVAKLMIDAGLIVIAAFVSPMIADRKKIAEIVGTDKFVEVFVDTSIEECEKRDTKGLYAKARKGEISNFTGVNAPYEAPTQNFIHIQTAKFSPEEASAEIVKNIQTKIILSK